MEGMKKSGGEEWKRRKKGKIERRGSKEERKAEREAETGKRD